MRLIDADDLSAFVGDLRSTLLKEQSTFKAMTQIEFNTRDYMLLNFQQIIDNAPTVKTFTLEDMTNNYSKGLAKGLSEWECERPKGKWVEVSKNVYRCSCCEVQDYYDYQEETCPNYCPNCGSDMREDEDDE